MTYVAQPNLSLNPDASSAALTRRPLGAGKLGSLGPSHREPHARLRLRFLCFNVALNAGSASAACSLHNSCANTSSVRRSLVANTVVT